MIKRNYTLFTLATTGILSYILATIIHEVIGHAGTCLLFGNKITLLTSTYFRSTTGNIIVDIGGPIANLIFGGLAFVLLKETKLPKLLVLQLIAYNLFWFSGTLLHSAASNAGDWTFAIEEISSGFFGKIILIVTGLLFYILFIRILNFYLSDTSKINQNDSISKQDILYSFLFAALAAFTAGLFFKKAPLHSAFECLLEMAASLPILLLRFNSKTKLTNHKYRNNNFFNFSVCILFIIFCFILGKGISQ